MEISKILIYLVAAAMLVMAALWILQVDASPTVESGNMDFYFPRSGADPAPVLAELYGMSSTYIDCAAYSLTNPTIINALKQAHSRGIRVRIITDTSQTEGKAQKVAVDGLLLVGIPVRLNNHSGLMHLKLSIIDGRWSTLGSYNYSVAASERNDEVFAVIDDPIIAAGCDREFVKLWDKFEPARMSY